ncbi:MAG: hypothetical protein R3C59_08700 [Planctomycetaceae bacterium]
MERDLQSADASPDALCKICQRSAIRISMQEQLSVLSPQLPHALTQRQVLFLKIEVRCGKLKFHDLFELVAEVQPSVAGLHLSVIQHFIPGNTERPSLETCP